MIFTVTKLLKEYEQLFDDIFGTFKTPLVGLELNKDTVPTHVRPFPVHRIHIETLIKRN